jgi:hypothetical protein
MNVGTTNWTVPWLNTSGYENNFYSIVVWFDLNGRVPNGTKFSNEVKANTTLISTTALSNTLTYGFFITKTANRTAIYWNDSAINYTINLTNVGDFYINGTKINETYSPNLTFGGSRIDGNQTNEQFNITQVTPGTSYTLWIRVNKSAADFVNGSNAYNNITAFTNESSSQLTATNSVAKGARTTQIRVTYEITFTDVGNIGSTVLNILGVVLIIGAILLIVTVVKNRGGFGE